MGQMTTTPQPSPKKSGSRAIAPTNRCTRGALIAIEGINGVGKTFLTARSIENLDSDHKPATLKGFSQRTGRGTLGTNLLGALRRASAPDPFLRSGAPVTEAFLLLAIKRCDFDALVPELASGRPVIEGRGIDTTAVCQALLLHPDDMDAALETAITLAGFAASYRPRADLTIVMTDEPTHAIGRAEQRDGRVITAEQAAFMQAANVLFEKVAASDPTRYHLVDRRRLDKQHATAQIQEWIVQAAATDQHCLVEPWQGPGARCLCCGNLADPAD